MSDYLTFDDNHYVSPETMIVDVLPQHFFLGLSPGIEDWENDDEIDGTLN